LKTKKDGDNLAGTMSWPDQDDTKLRERSGSGRRGDHRRGGSGRDVRIRYSTVGVVLSANSADPSSGRTWR
jgi:hypothetical protein